MPIPDSLSLGFGSRLPVTLQTEATECGLACLSMVASYHGLRIDMSSMRRMFQVSLMGSTLAHLIQISSSLNLSSRAVKLDLEDLPQLRTPCVLHWNFSHFVVLKEVGARHIWIHDPAQGKRRVPMDEVSKSFTGVALELWPNEGFRHANLRQRVKLRQLMGRVSGLVPAFGQVLLLAGALEVFALVTPFFLQWVVDEVIVAADRDLLTTLGIGFTLLVILQQAVSAMRAWVMMYLSTTLNLQWRSNMFSHLLRLPIAYFEKRHLGDMVSRFGSIDVIQRTITSSFLEAIIDGAMSIVVIVMMYIYSPQLTLIAIGVMTIYAMVRWVSYRPLRIASEEQIVHAARQQSHFLETMRGIKAIKLSQRQDERRNSWLALVVDQINADLRIQKAQTVYRHINGLLFGLERIAIIWLGARIVLDGSFSVGALLAFAAYKDQFAGRMSALVDKTFEVKMLQLHGDRLADIAFTEPELEQHASRGSARAKFEARIELQDVRFRYGDHENWILDGVSFRIEPGESVAIIGPSGCGKSTLISVILGIRQPTEGKVLISGQDVAQIGFGTLRRNIGTVTQDDVLFTGSIADNICFFDPNSDMKWIEKCARLAAVHDDIDAMPMGYMTQVGDMGTVLSGGQRQRILLARALYRKPRILILDEATSNLDIDREKEVNAAVRALRITRLIVAHRPETIASANRVILLKDGKVRLDSGTSKKESTPVSGEAETARSEEANVASLPPNLRLHG